MRTLLSSLGSVAAAVLASACCWLPLLLLSLGAGAATVTTITASIETARPVLAVVALPLLGAAWYFAFFRRLPRPGAPVAAASAEACCEVPGAGPGGAQAVRRVRRANKVLLPGVTVIVLAMILFPHQVFAFLVPSGGSSARAAEASTTGTHVGLRVPGMT
ncbi:MAG: hypothetical protein L0216_11300 [Planctomycetales bacterium]|nr:hypothetical protein [Planctomycetales bacterium]